jgi:hypothetical protein
MISNLGFGEHGTHTLDPFHPQANAERAEIEFPLQHPPHVLRDVMTDHETQRYQFSRPIRRWHILRRAVHKFQRSVETWRSNRLDKTP